MPRTLNKRYALKKELLRSKTGVDSSTMDRRCKTVPFPTERYGTNAASLVRFRPSEFSASRFRLVLWEFSGVFFSERMKQGTNG